MKDMSKASKSQLITFFDETIKLINKKNNENNEIKKLENEQKQLQEKLSKAKNSLNQATKKKVDKFQNKDSYIEKNKTQTKKVKFSLILFLVFVIIMLLSSIYFDSISSSDKFLKKYEAKNTKFEEKLKEEYPEYYEAKNSSDEQTIKSAKKLVSTKDIITSELYASVHNNIIVNHEKIFKPTFWFLVFLTLSFLTIGSVPLVGLIFLCLAIYNIKTLVQLALIIFVLIISLIISIYINKILKNLNEQQNVLNLRKVEKQYELEHQKYLKEKEKLDLEYKQRYEKQKQDINVKIEELEKLIEENKENIQKKQNDLPAIDKEINNYIDGSIHIAYQDANILTIFKDYIIKGRCDSLKECINLYEQEKSYQSFQAKVNSVSRYAESMSRRQEEKYNSIRKELETEKENNKEFREKATDEIQNMASNVDRIDIEQKSLQIRDENRRTKYTSKEDYEKEKDDAIKKAKNIVK